MRQHQWQRLCRPLVFQGQGPFRISELPFALAVNLHRGAQFMIQYQGRERSADIELARCFLRVEGFVLGEGHLPTGLPLNLHGGGKTALGGGFHADIGHRAGGQAGQLKATPGSQLSGIQPTDQLGVVEAK